MIRMITFLVTIAFAGVAAHGQQAGDPVSSTLVREIADGLAGVTINDGKVADKIVYLGRDSKGEVVINGIAAVAPGTNEGIEPPDKTIAIVRTRASTSNNNMAPELADERLAMCRNLPVFIIGEWAKPPIVWEIRRVSSGITSRTIDAQGKPGDWRPATATPSCPSGSG